MSDFNLFKIAANSVNKGVREMGPACSLETHNLGQAVEQLDADVVRSKAVRHVYRLDSRQFVPWPIQPQHAFLRPKVGDAVYQNNALIGYGEHGHAMPSHWPVAACQNQHVSGHLPLSAEFELLA